MFKVCKYLVVIATAMAVTTNCFAQRVETILSDGWLFKHGTPDSVGIWQPVVIPHDWAIYGPFSRDNDLQCVKVEQNNETESTWKTGRTGGLPFIGKGCYSRYIDIPDTVGVTYTLLFDGAMSNAKVSVNGHQAISWPYGYNSFYVNIDSLIHIGSNELLVELENYDQQSRWYPGAGLYRNVHLIQTGRINVPVWGMYITTPTIADDFAIIRIETEINGANSFEQWPYGESVGIKTEIIAPDGTIVAMDSTEYRSRGQKLVQNITLNNPLLWNLDSPNLYTARQSVSVENKISDIAETRFGVRNIEYIPDRGFFLNGKKTKFKGVCNHHDLGPLGAAVNKAAVRHQVELLKGMGANAIRTSHNMPAPELVSVCDELGMMLMIEPFDDWGFRPKSANGYGKVFNDWAERDVTNMIKQYRSSPSVVMWSIGNEVPSQWGEPGIRELTMLQNLVHKLDPTRPVTCGMDQIGAVIDLGFAAALDIPGFNYKPQHYQRIYHRLPQKLVLGTETASLVSSRGEYIFPLEIKADALHENHQSSSYATEYCNWSNIPDLDFAADEDFTWLLGQFVWTGFDYLGEPSPYDTDAWPNHSSMFGIFDLASLPKDIYYLYRSQWREDDATLHILPHWTWHGREGLVTPVMVYTSYPEAELFINGVSQGRLKKDTSIPASTVRPGWKEYDDYTLEHRREDAEYLMKRYRLIWPDVVYQPGEVRVVAYDSYGNAADQKIVKTAGKPHHIVLSADRVSLTADGADLAYITVQIADKEGNIVPTDNRQVAFSVKGAGTFRATANGDPTCLEPFHKPQISLFNGAATAIVQASKNPGEIVFEAKAKGVAPARLSISSF